MRTLTFAVVIAATAAHAQEPSKPRFEPIEVMARDMYAPPLCRLWFDKPGWTNEKSGMVYHRACTAAETRERMEPIARSARARLGDPGRH